MFVCSCLGQRKPKKKKKIIIKQKCRSLSKQCKFIFLSSETTTKKKKKKSNALLVDHGSHRRCCYWVFYRCSCSHSYKSHNVRKMFLAHGRLQGCQENQGSQARHQGRRQQGQEN